MSIVKIVEQQRIEKGTKDVPCDNGVAKAKKKNL